MSRKFEKQSKFVSELEALVSIIYSVAVVIIPVIGFIAAINSILTGKDINTFTKFFDISAVLAMAYITVLFKRFSLASYGALEVIGASVSAWLALDKFSDSTMSNAAIFLGSVYFMSRGISNIMDGMAGKLKLIKNSDLSRYGFFGRILKELLYLS